MLRSRVFTTIEFKEFRRYHFPQNYLCSTENFKHFGVYLVPRSSVFIINVINTKVKNKTQFVRKIWNI